jgi:hypothetical protein
VDQRGVSVLDFRIVLLVYSRYVCILALRKCVLIVIIAFAILLIFIYESVFEGMHCSINHV